jgi:hypothetical protein
LLAATRSKNGFRDTQRPCVPICLTVATESGSLPPAPGKKAGFILPGETNMDRSCRNIAKVSFAAQHVTRCWPQHRESQFCGAAGDALLAAISRKSVLRRNR